jgi:hypothetical protein
VEVEVEVEVEGLPLQTGVVMGSAVRVKFDGRDFLLPGGPVMLQEHGLLPHVGQSIFLAAVVSGQGGRL